MRAPTITKLKLTGWLLLAITGIAGWQVQTASAHYVYQSGNLYQSSTDCTWGYSEVSHGNGNGYSKSEVRARWVGDQGSWCSHEFYRPAGYMRVRQIFQAQLAPGWGYCRDTGDIYNGSQQASMVVARTHSGKCGTTNYRTESRLHQLNGSWKGGTLLSGTHWL